MIRYCEYCHKTTEQNRYHPLTCGQCGAEYKAEPKNDFITQNFSNVLAQSDPESWNKNAQTLRQAQDELSAALDVQAAAIGREFLPKFGEWVEMIAGTELCAGDPVYFGSDSRVYK